MKKVIMILIIIVIILSIGLLIVVKINSKVEPEKLLEVQKERESYLNTINNPGLLVDGITPKRVTASNMFFTIEECAKQYIQYAIENNTKAIQSLLDEKYLEKEKLDIQKINTISKTYTKNNFNKTVEMYEIPGLKYYTYYIKHKLGKETIYFVVNTDASVNTFSVVPIEKTYYTTKILEQVKASSNQEETIQKNNYNTISYKYYEEEDIADKYLQDYLNNALLYPEEAYETLDKEYKEKKFGSLEAYKKYVEKNKEKLQSMCKSQRKEVTDFEDYKEYEEYFRKVYEIGLEKYQISTKNGNEQYILIDSYGNYYIFNTNGVMNYSLVLDTYTVDQPEFIEKYAKMSESEKIQANIEKVFEAINLGDYAYMYHKLDQTFKSTYFKTEQEFETYMKTNFFENNNIRYKDYQRNGEVYVYNIQVVNEENTASIQKKVIMQLKDGTDFVMSFNVE